MPPLFLLRRSLERRGPLAATRPQSVMGRCPRSEVCFVRSRFRVLGRAAVEVAVAEPLEQQIESRVAAEGFELVELEQAGSKSRPILRLRIERPDATPGQSGVTLEDCTRVSRAVEAYLDEQADLGERYVLEVSSPGLERPLTRRRDYERFAGQEVALRTSEAVGDHGKRLEGVLRGINADDVVSIEMNGQPIEVRLGNIKKGHLVFRWQEKGKK